MLDLCIYTVVLYYNIQIYILRCGIITRDSVHQMKLYKTLNS